MLAIPCTQTRLPVYAYAKAGGLRSLLSNIGEAAFIGPK
jgi:hypothetical protein